MPAHEFSGLPLHCVICGEIIFGFDQINVKGDAHYDCHDARELRDQRTRALRLGLA